MPTLVAVSAAPRKTAVLASSPRALPAIAPPANGSATPMTATSIDAWPTLLQLDEVHLHADLHEQQQHTDLGEDADRHAASAVELDQARAPMARSRCRPRSRRARPATRTVLGQLGGQLGREQHDQQVEQQPSKVDRRSQRTSLMRPESKAHGKASRRT